MYINRCSATSSIPRSRNLTRERLPGIASVTFGILGINIQELVILPDTFIGKLIAISYTTISLPA